jgi:hypothetical protein
MSSRKTTKKPATQAELSRKALKLKSRAEPAPHPPAKPDPGEGIRSVPNPKTPPPGALDAEGQRPVLERSRKVR